MSHERLAIAENTSLRETSNDLALGFLAVVNNIGHVHANIRCFEEAGVCRNDLSFRLSAVPAAPILSEAEAQVFILDACFFRKTQLVSTPAACTNPSSNQCTLPKVDSVSRLPGPHLLLITSIK
jgi:hypothetical protein